MSNISAGLIRRDSSIVDARPLIGPSLSTSENERDKVGIDMVNGGA